MLLRQEVDVLLLFLKNFILLPKMNYNKLCDMVVLKINTEIYAVNAPAKLCSYSNKSLNVDYKLRSYECNFAF